MLSRHKINDYCIVRGYKNGQTPGYLNIDIDKKVFYPKFVKELLNRHYGNDFSKQNAIDIIPYVVIDTSEDEIIAFHLYDDRGYYEYYIPKKKNQSRGQV